MNGKLRALSRMFLNGERLSAGLYDSYINFHENIKEFSVGICIERTNISTITEVSYFSWGENEK